ncbi:MAG: hypothetical protein GWP19_15220 [Planctomycetia bacterium]|nr:hypothetical protein [Planctomycetia bacterium]
MSDYKNPVKPKIEPAPVVVERPLTFRRKVFLWIFRRQVADIIHNHSESIQLRYSMNLHKSGLRSFVEALEFIVGDIAKYFTLGSGLSARRAMKEMQDFCGLKLKTLKKLLIEYERLEDVNAERPTK